MTETFKLNSYSDGRVKRLDIQIEDIKRGEEIDTGIRKDGDYMFYDLWIMPADYKEGNISLSAIAPVESIEELNDESLRVAIEYFAEYDQGPDTEYYFLLGAHDKTGQVLIENEAELGITRGQILHLLKKGWKKKR